MQIINYFDYDDKTSIILQLEKLQGEWRAIGFLLSLLKDEVISEFSPWIGFVFTAPAWRGRHLAGKIIEHCMKISGTVYPNSEYVYVSTDEECLYEKYGFRRHHVIKDFFTKNYDHPIIECGLQLVDMIVLRKNI